MATDPNELQAINTSWQIAIQEILRMVIRDMYHAGGEASFNTHIKGEKRIHLTRISNLSSSKRVGGSTEVMKFQRIRVSLLDRNLPFA